MAGRPLKGRIDFAGWSVDMFDSDTKIDKLIDAHGWIGFSIWFYLCQRAYGSDGYFYRWGYDDSASTARKMGGGVGSGTIQEVVGYCLQIGLFDNRVFAGWGVLTSRGIQKRYCVAAAERRDKTVAAEYWLLSDEESAGFTKCSINSDSSPTNAHYSMNNTDLQPDKSIIPPKRKVKESRVKESKGEGRTTAPDKPVPRQPQTRFIPPSLDEVRAYCAERKNKVDPERWHSYYTANGWRVGKNPMKDWRAAVRTWERNAVGSDGGFKTSPAKTVPAQDYRQRDYDDEALKHLTVDISKIPCE